MHCEGEQGYDYSAPYNGQDEPSFGLPVGLELSGKRPIGKVLKLAAPDEMGRSSSPDTLEVARARATERLIGRRVARGQRLREIATAPDGACHQEERAD
jgi:hypothetical protein